MTTVYVCAKSKKHANELVAAGTLLCTEHCLGRETVEYMRAMPTGTVVKIYSKMVGGSPYARFYGTWNKEKNKIV